jgi:hypothetical protein
LTLASLLLDKGCSVAYVKEQLGHASIRTTVDTYAHLIRGESKRAVDLLDERPDDAATRKLYASEGVVQLKVYPGVAA